MLDSFELENVESLSFTIRQMYDYLKIGVSIGYPAKMSFEFDVSVKDVDMIIKKLQEGRFELKKALQEQRNEVK